MNPAIKTSLWILSVLIVVGGAAAPKVMPLLHTKVSGESGGAQVRAEGAAAKGKGDKGKEGTAAPLHVTAYVVQPTRFAETITATGSLRAEESVELQAETNGKVVAINFTEGARVKKGTLLVKLNDADLVATRIRAMRRKELAVLKEHRLAELLKEGVARQEDYDTALNDVNVQNAEIELTEAMIAKTEVRAPFDGVVGLRYVSEGSFVNAQTRVATLQSLDNLKIDFSVPEKYASRLRVGMPISFAIAGIGRKFEGQVYAFDPRIDPATRTVFVRGKFRNEQDKLLPGAFANIELILDALQNALMVPAVAVIPGLNEKNVFIVSDGKAVRRPVETGTRTETTVHILSGLQLGDVVITSGLQQLRPGAPVVAEGADTEHGLAQRNSKKGKKGAAEPTASALNLTDEHRL
jgi:membrane fusion protein (multidrug efflux system)